MTRILTFTAISLMLFFTSCGRVESTYERNAKELLLQVEHDYFCADWHDYSSVEARIDSMQPLSEHDRKIEELMKWRITRLNSIKEDELLSLAQYFTSQRDSLFASASYALLSDYIIREKTYNVTSPTRREAMRYISMAEELCPKQSCTILGRIIYSKSYLYRAEFPERKIELLRRAISIFEQDTNSAYIGYCYRDLMEAFISMEMPDSARHYGDIGMKPEIINRLDTMQRMRFMWSYAWVFNETLSGDSIVALSKPLYDSVPYTYYAYLVALGYLRMGNIASAVPYIRHIGQRQDMSLYYHYLLYEKAIALGDYRTATEELKKSKDMEIGKMKKLYSQNVERLESDVRHTLEAEETERMQRRRERHFWIAISLLLSVSLTVTLYMYRRNIRLNQEITESRKKLEATKFELEHAENEYNTRLDERRKQIKALTEIHNSYRQKISDIIISDLRSRSRISESELRAYTDIAGDGLCRLMSEEYGLSETETVILFLHHTGFTYQKISEMLGYASANSITHAIRRIRGKIDLLSYESVDEWFDAVLEKHLSVVTDNSKNND